MHDGGMILDADFGGDFGGTTADFFGNDKHGDLAGVFNIGDA